MFEDLRKAWREAVENFRRELEDDDAALGGDRRISAMRRDLETADGELRRLRAELSRARRRLEEERKEIGVCRRREALARGIGDEETAEIARRFAEKHTERAAVLEKLVDALEAESGLLEREVAEMDRLLREQMLATPPGPDPLDRARDDAEFRRLEHEQRERAAAERLEELKRRMR